MALAFWPRNINLKLELPDKNYLNFDIGSNNKTLPSELHESHEGKDFPETLRHKPHVTSPILDLRTQACQINY